MKWNNDSTRPFHRCSTSLSRPRSRPTGQSFAMGPLDVTMVELEIRSQADVKQVESRSTEDELARQGEALEAAEKTLGLWQAIKLHKMALVYSQFGSEAFFCTVH